MDMHIPAYLKRFCHLLNHRQPATSASNRHSCTSPNATARSAVDLFESECGDAAKEAEEMGYPRHPSPLKHPGLSQESREYLDLPDDEAVRPTRNALEDLPHYT